MSFKDENDDRDEDEDIPEPLERFTPLEAALLRLLSWVDPAEGGKGEPGAWVEQQLTAAVLARVEAFERKRRVRRKPPKRAERSDLSTRLGIPEPEDEAPPAAAAG